MSSNASSKSRAPCPRCAHLLHLLYQEVKGLKEHTMEIHRFILKKEEEETTYRDANYVVDRVGISKSTLLRYQGRGIITVAKIVNKKKLYRDLDVERLRKIYWGVGE